MLNKILENDLKKSLFIEYYYGRKIIPSYFLTENKQTLCEEHGIMPHMDEYIDTFLDYMHNIAFEEKPKSFILSDNIFRNIENCFFQDVWFTIELCKTENSNVNAYIKTERQPEFEDGKLECISGKFHIYCPEERFDSALATMLAHELTHAYENYLRIKSNAPSLYDVLKHSNYSNNTDRRGSTVYDRKMISHIVYYTTKFEVNAYAASIYGTLKAHANEMQDAQDTLDIIKFYSNAYQAFVTLGKYIQGLNDNFNNGQLNTQIVEDAWLSAMGEKRNCKSIIKKVTALYNKTWRKIKKVTSKICYDVYEKYGPLYTVDEDNFID